MGVVGSPEALATLPDTSTMPSVQKVLARGEREIKERWKNIHSNTEANLEMAMQERMQREQEEELALVQKLAVARRYAKEFEKRRATPY